MLESISKILTKKNTCNMKTPEEVYGEVVPKWSLTRSQHREYALKAMQEYSNQQKEELVKRVEELEKENTQVKYERDLHRMGHKACDKNYEELGEKYNQLKQCADDMEKALKLCVKRFEGLCGYGEKKRPDSNC